MAASDEMSKCSLPDIARLSRGLNSTLDLRGLTHSLVRPPIETSSTSARLRRRWLRDKNALSPGSRSGSLAMPFADRNYQIQTNRGTARAKFGPATPYCDSIVRPKCPECGSAAFLVGIEPERPGYKLHTFQCPKCEHFETAVGKPHRPVTSC